MNSKTVADLNITITLNEILIFQVLLVNSIGFLITAVLVFLFSNSLYSFICSVIFGLTLITLLIYFLVKRNRKRFFNTSFSKKQDEEKEEFHSIMKIE